MSWRKVFGRAAAVAAQACATWQASVLITASVAVWAAHGGWRGLLLEENYLLPFVTWMSAVSYIVPFFILYAQDQDTRSIQLKLDELIRAVQGARDEVAGIEDRDEDERQQLKNRNINHEKGVK